MKLGRRLDRCARPLAARGGAAAASTSSARRARASASPRRRRRPRRAVCRSCSFRRRAARPPRGRQRPRGTRSAARSASSGSGRPRRTSAHAAGAAALAATDGRRLRPVRRPRAAPRRPARHASDNRVELDRARHALAAATGRRRSPSCRRAIPGIFAMATAVFEAIESGPPSSRTSTCASSPACRRCTPPPPASARRSATTSRSSLSDQRKPWAVVERRLEAAVAADFALALYNPASLARRAQA